MKKLIVYLLSVFCILSSNAETSDSTSPKYCANYQEEKCNDCCESKDEQSKTEEECKDPNVSSADKDDCGNSFISTLTYSYTHFSKEFSSKLKNGEGCGPCSGGVTSNSALPELAITRMHKFRQMSDRGSFGMGVFMTFDIYFKLYESGGTPRVDMFFAGDRNNRRYFKQGNKFFDTFARSSKELVLYTEGNEITTSIANAAKAELKSFDGRTYHFRIFSEDDQVKWARLHSYENAVGYSIDFEYLHELNDDVAYDDKFMLSHIQDSSERVVAFEYLAARRMGVNVISKMILPNGSSIDYVYGSTPSNEESDEYISQVNYPDGTSSTFVVPDPVDGFSEVQIFEAGEHSTHRNKKVLMTNLFSATGNKARDGQSYFNTASLLIQKVKLGNTDELSFEIFQNPNGANNRRVYQGGNKLKTVNIVSAKYYKEWNKGSDSFDGFTGLKTEETSAKGDFKFYSGNAQGRPPLMFDKHGLKYKYLYNGDNKLVKKVYEDGTFEAWSYNEVNFKTRYRDRLGRVTRYEYDVDGQPSLMTKKIVGLQAQVSGSANEEIPGLLARVYDWTGNVLPTNFESLSAVETLSVPNLELDVSDRDERYAMLFTGKIEISTEGEYNFFLSSDDGSKLYINGVEVIDNDGAHGNREIATEVPITLTEGKHDIRVEFFEKYGQQVLSLAYSGPDSDNVKVQIPDSAYSHMSVEEELGEVDQTTEETAQFVYTYYPAGQPNQFLLETETDANGNVTSYEYYPDNLLKHIKTMDDDGNLNAITKSTFSYDSAKRLKTSSDAAGRTTTYFYDSRDRVTKIEYSDFSTEVFFYGKGLNANLLLKQKDRNGNTTKFEYDSQGRRKTTITAFSVMPANPSDIDDEIENTVAVQSVERCTYVPGTSLKATCSIDGDLIEYIYDYRNRLIEMKRHADNNSILTTKNYYKNNLIQWKEDPYGRRTYFSYRIRGDKKSDTVMTRKVQETIPGAVTLNNGYYSEIDALDIIDGANASYLLTEYKRDSEGQTVELIDPRGIVHRSVYDSRGRTVIQISDYGLGNFNQTKEIVYDLNSNIIEVRNPRYFSESINDRVRMAYTSRNLLESRTVAYSPNLDENDPLNISATEYFTYYSDGRSENHVDFNGNISTKVWKQCCGRLGVVAGPAFTDKDGNNVRRVTLFQYDYFGNKTHTAEMVYGENEVLPSCCEVNPDNTKTVKEITTRFDARHRPIARTVWLDPITTNVDSRQNPPIFGESGAPEGKKGLTTKFDYYDDADSSIADISTILTKLPVEVQMGTFTNGSAVVTENGEGEKAVSLMDGIGRIVASGMLSKLDSSLLTWNTVVNDIVTNSLLESKSISALGFINKVFTDGAGRRIKTIDAEGKESTFFYDNNSNLTSFRDANGIGKDCTFDNLNRDVECKDTFGDIIGKDYDLNNNLVSVTDANGKTKTCVYDARNRKESCTERTNGVISYTYDDNSNMKTIIDQLGNETKYDYDSRNLQVKVTYADHIQGQTYGDDNYGITECSYDALGRKSLFTDQKGDNITYIYDMASRMKKRQYRYYNISTTESVDLFTYDNVSRMETAYKERYDNKITLTYDEIGRKKTETTQVGSNGSSPVSFTVSYNKYDVDNRLEEILYPTGNSSPKNKLVKTYTDRNQLETLTFNASPIINNFSYDDGMREKERSFGNGLISTRAYRNVGSGDTAQIDNLLSGISVSGKNELSFDYEYDANKNVTKETTSGVTSGYSWDATFDDKDRIDTWTRSGAANTALPKIQDWTLDDVGNWDEVTTDGVLEDRNHNNTHEISLINPTGEPSSVPSFDAKGNLLSSPGSPYSSSTLTWDIDNHLNSFSKDGVTVTFSYDALGRRLEKSSLSNSITYISAGHQILEEYSKTSEGYNLERSYVYGMYIDDVVAKVEASNTPSVLYYHSDRQFNVRGLTDASGAIRELYAYSPYGKQIVMNASSTDIGSTSFNNNYGFTGRYSDIETGLWYFRARYFDNQLGRFISRDPMSYVDGMSLYTGYFAAAFWVDPTGTMTPTTDSIGGRGMPFPDRQNPSPSHTPDRRYLPEPPPPADPHPGPRDDREQAGNRDCNTFNCAGFSFYDYQWHSVESTKKKLKQCKKVACSEECKCGDRKCWLWTWDYSVYAYLPRPYGKTLINNRYKDFHIMCYDQGAKKKYAKTARGPIREVNDPSSERPNERNPASPPRNIKLGNRTFTNVIIQIERENMTEDCYCCPKYFALM